MNLLLLLVRQVSVQSSVSSRACAFGEALVWKMPQCGVAPSRECFGKRIGQMNFTSQALHRLGCMGAKEICAADHRCIGVHSSISIGCLLMKCFHLERRQGHCVSQQKCVHRNSILNGSRTAVRQRSRTKMRTINRGLKVLHKDVAKGIHAKDVA